jgi:hypothetical protein
MIILSLSACFGLSLIDIAGTWSGYMSWTTGPATGFETPITLVLEQEEESTQITGSVSLTVGTESFSIPITEGIAGNGSFTIEAIGIIDVAAQQIEVQIELKGGRNGDVLSGTGTQRNDGVPYTFNWTATLQTSDQ